MFYKKNLNIGHGKEVYNFLLNHFKYPIDEDKNNLTIANNVKVYNLDLKNNFNDCLDTAWYNAKFTCLSYELIDIFEENHPGYAVGFAGRSNGYLLLTAKGPEDTLNPVIPHYLTNIPYEDFKRYNREIDSCCYFYEEKRREIAKVVRDFDKLCDELTKLLDDITSEYLEDKLRESNTSYYVYHSSVNDINNLAATTSFKCIADAVEEYNHQEPFGFDLDEVKLVKLEKKENKNGFDFEYTTLMYKGGYSMYDLVK